MRYYTTCRSYSLNISFININYHYYYLSMKIKSILTILLVLSSVVLFSQTQNELLSEQLYELKWNPVQTWTTTTASKKVISFEDASYPSDNYLAYFTKRISLENKNMPSLSVTNAEFVALSAEELEIFPTDISLSEHLSIQTIALYEKGNRDIEIQVLPFVKREGQILKAKSFKITTQESTQPYKAMRAQLHTFSENSVLESGKFIKIKIKDTGIYKLTYDDLKSMGLSPANVRVFGYGGNVLDQDFMQQKHDDLPELAIHMEKGSDGVFNSGDYILFYALGIVKWTYNNFVKSYEHQGNTYSTEGYYYLSSDAGVGRRISTKSITVADDAVIETIDEFNDYSLHELDLYSIASSGKEFYGELFSDKLSLNLSFDFPNLVKSKSVYADLNVAAISYSASGPASSFYLSLNSGQTKKLSVPLNTSDQYEKAKPAKGRFSFTADTDKLNMTLSYNKTNDASKGYLNYLRLNARRQLIMHGAAMRFENADHLATNKYGQYNLGNPTPTTQIWDISDHTNIVRIETQSANGNLQFTDSIAVLKTYLAIDPKSGSSFPKPEVVGEIKNQNLHGLPLMDMVILTHPRFISQSERLAQAHREIDNLTVAVVTTEQVYNEFSSGSADATAYRWLMKMFYDRANQSGATDQRPKYLLLFGRGSFDNRNILKNNSSENLILTYQADNSLVETLSYVTDDYFGFLDNEEGSQLASHKLDIGIGRFPALSTTDADDMVNKTIRYMRNETKTIWKNQLCFIGDDGDNALHMQQADSITRIINRKYPDYQINKIYLDAYLQEIDASGETYPLARTQLHNLINSGLLYLNFTGHAGPVGWTNEQIMSVGDVKGLTNTKLPLWVGSTCDFLLFDALNVSAGEHVLLNPNGGGIGILSATRPVFASQNFIVNKYFSDYLFQKNAQGEHLRVGDALAMAKNSVGTETNKLSYVYVGDPAVKLNYPTKYKVKTTHINESTSFGTDTLRAMAVVDIKGEIVDHSGNKMSDFDGDLQAVVFDKSQLIVTLDNEKEFGNNEARKFKYYDRTNKLFAGKVKVENGEFSFSFMLPKDIKYNFGRGRINYYATASNSDSEAQGSFENFVVGGTNPDYVYETEGPEIQAYLNAESFQPGDKVNETPLFVAKLNDQSGINRVGSGIGHDLVLTIDDSPLQSYIVNDYYESSSHSHTQGEVRYKLPEMQNGKHTLTFRAWDLLNNSSSTTFEFEVVKGLTPQIFSVSNYPNPVVSSTRIKVNHDRPETILNTSVDIFDLAGRKVWSFKQNNADDISWNLNSLDGVKVKTGIYLYRVSISTSESEIFSKTNKMIIVEQ